MPNQFCTLFDVDQPIVLAPMAGAVPPELVAAVSNAGGLGLAPLWHVDVDTLVSSIRTIKDLTDKPFGVNLNVEFMKPGQLDACLEEGVPIISMFWQPPGDLVAQAKSGGAKVIYSAGSAADAKAAVDIGVDAICAQGWEAGGHVRGTVGTMALVPAIADAVPGIPVIAAGGIADGRGLAAAMALGASAAWIGTRFLAADEASIHPGYLSRLIDASEDDTSYYEDLYDVGWPNAPHRALINSTDALWQNAGRPPMGQRPNEGEIVARTEQNGAVQRYQSGSPRAGHTGNIEAMSLWAGQGVSMVKHTQPAHQIVHEIVDEARLIQKQQAASQS